MTFGVLELYYSCQILFLPGCRKPSLRNSPSKTPVRQLLEMLEAVTRMESTYLTRIDINAQRQQIMFAHNSSEMQIPEGFSVPQDESLCKRALEDQCTFSNDVARRWHSCIAARELGIATF